MAEVVRNYWLSPDRPQWSAKIVPRKGVTVDEFEQALLFAAGRTGHRYAGFLTTHRDGTVAGYTHTLYPRKKYPLSTPAQAAAAMKELGNAFRWGQQPDRHKADTLRAVLGLYKGQQESYTGRSPDFDIREVARRLKDSKATSATLVQAEIMTVRLGKQNTVYREPAALVIAALRDQVAVCSLGFGMRQERFTLERFPRSGGATVNTVETIYCRQPEFK